MHTLRGAGSFIEEWFAMIYMGLWVLAFLAMLLGVRLKRVTQEYILQPPPTPTLAAPTPYPTLEPEWYIPAPNTQRG